MIAFADWRIEENAKNQFQQIESPRDSTDATSPFSPSQRPLRLLLRLLRLPNETAMVEIQFKTAVFSRARSSIAGQLNRN
jgi:hypothetical protein